MSLILTSVFVLFLAGLALLYYSKKSAKPVPIIVEEKIIELPEPEIEEPPPIEPLDLEKEFANLIAQAPDIQSLFSRLDCRPDSQPQIDELRDLIALLISADYKCKLISNHQSVPLNIENKSNRYELQKTASRYLESKWIHTPSLAALIVVALLDNEFDDQFKSSNGSLKLIRDEIANRSFDTNEVIRRLRRIEEQGCYFSTLVFPILTEGQTSETEAEIIPETTEETVHPIPEPVWGLEQEVSKLISEIPELAFLRENLKGENTSTEFERFHRLLEAAVTAHHEHELSIDTNQPLNGEQMSALKKRVQNAARNYLNSPSLQNPWLSRYVTAALLYAEIVSLPNQSPAQPLRIVADDFAVCNCDSAQTIERLRSIEDRGVYVSSLIYTFLAPPDPVKPSETQEEILDSLDVKQAVQQLIETNAELSDLYKRLGYSAELDRSSGQLLKEMKDLIRTEIPDFGAFKSALKTAQDQAEKQFPMELGMAPTARIKYQPENSALLSAVLAAAEDQQQVFELLNRDPINEQLPFIEQLPVFKNGATVWRTPLEHSLIKKRPSDPDLFASLLDQLEALFNEVRHPQNRQVYDEVLEAIARVRRDLVKETAYMPTALQALETKVADYMAHSRNAATQAKKDQLDSMLEDLLRLRHNFSVIVRKPEIQLNSELPALRQSIQQMSKKYLDATWMYTPWLITRMLATLLDCELALFDKDEIASADNPAGVLKIVRDEIDKDCYDSEESIRRLQYQETRGLYINSLIYPLLRLNTVTAVGRSRVAAAKAGSANA